MAAFPRRAYEGAATPTTIVSGVDTAASTVTLADSTGWPTGFPFFVILDQEILASQEKCIATRSGVTLTISRGEDGTTPKSHVAGASIKPIFSAVEADEANQMAALITTRGDSIRGGVSGTPERLALGTSGHIKTSNGTDEVWAAPATQTPGADSITTAMLQDKLLTDAKRAPRTVNVKTDNYTLALGDEFETVSVDGTSKAVTVPPTASVAFAAGIEIDVFNWNSTVLTITPGAGVTVRAPAGLTLAQYQSGKLFLSATTNEWLFWKFDVTAPAGGLVCIKAETAFTTVSTITVDSIFTADYTNYLIVIHTTAMTGIGLRTLQLRAAGVTAATNYNRQELNGVGTVAGANRVAAQTSFSFDTQSNVGLLAVSQIELFAPQLAVATAIMTQTICHADTPGAAPCVDVAHGNHTTATAHDGIIITAGSGTCTGTYTIYARSKAI